MEVFKNSEQVLESFLRQNNYQIQKKIAVGGTSEVFLIKNSHNQDLILKVVKESQNFNYMELLGQKSLAFKAFPRVLNVSFRNSKAFIVQEYIQGKTLRNLVLDKRNKLGLADKIDILVKLLEALVFLNDLGILHRDIKPKNIIITDDKQVRLIDFGSAKLINSVDFIDDLAIGTRGYTAPERYQRSPADIRSEIFSFGCLAFFLFTGNPSHEYLNQKDLTYSFDTLRLRLKCPRRLTSIILKCMSFDPKERYESFEEILSALIVEK